MKKNISLGSIVDKPQEPLNYDKFVNSLKDAGIDIARGPETRVDIFDTLKAFNTTTGKEAVGMDIPLETYKEWCKFGKDEIEWPETDKISLCGINISIGRRFRVY